MAREIPADASAWRRHRVKLLAVGLVALLAWLAYYLENVPLSRDFGPPEAKLAKVSQDDALQFGGISDGPVGSFRTVGARRLVVTLPEGAQMQSPEASAFAAKAQKERTELAGLSCGSGQSILDARPGSGENATVGLAVAKEGGTGGLLIAKPDPARYKNAMLVRADGAALNVGIALNRSGEQPPSGRMTLCRSGAAAILGQAEFRVPAGEPVVVEFLDPTAAPGTSDAVFEQPQSIILSSVAVGRLDEDGAFEPDRLACGADRKGTRLWARLMPRVGLSDCAARSLAITGFDPATGEIAVSKRPAYFQGFDEKKDSARFVSKALSNPVLQQLLIGGLLGSTLIPWALRQFRKKEEDDDEERPVRRRRRKKRPA